RLLDALDPLAPAQLAVLQADPLHALRALLLDLPWRCRGGWRRRRRRWGGRGRRGGRGGGGGGGGGGGWGGGGGRGGRGRRGGRRRWRRRRRWMIAIGHVAGPVHSREAGDRLAPRGIEQDPDEVVVGVVPGWIRAHRPVGHDH